MNLDNFGQLSCTFKYRPKDSFDQFFYIFFIFVSQNLSLLFINVQRTYDENFGLKLLAESILCSKNNL